jgi:hypothetical protein
VPFVDRLLRQGHLSDDVLASAVVTGERPGHLDRCATCATRALELSRWLDGVRSDAVAAADAAFPADKLAIQHAEILRRIELAEEPVRVLEFPKVQPSGRGAAASVRRVSAGWIGLAAAAGLALGIIGGHVSARLESGTAARGTQPPAQTAAPSFDLQPLGPGVTPLFDVDVDTVAPATLQRMDENTPHLVATQYAAR